MIPQKQILNDNSSYTGLCQVLLQKCKKYKFQILTEPIKSAVKYKKYVLYIQ